MNKELHRYLFTVRQRFDQDPVVDCFYKLVSPSGLSTDEMRMMTTLKPGWEAESLKADTSALSGMQMRLRFNSDMYQKVCLIRTESEFTADDLSNYLLMKFKDKELTAFLDDAAI